MPIDPRIQLFHDFAQERIASGASCRIGTFTNSTLSVKHLNLQCPILLIIEANQKAPCAFSVIALSRDYRSETESIETDQQGVQNYLDLMTMVPADTAIDTKAFIHSWPKMMVPSF